MLSDEKGDFNGVIFAVFEPLQLMKTLESVFMQMIWEVQLFMEMVLYF